MTGTCYTGPAVTVTTLGRPCSDCHHRWLIGGRDDARADWRCSACGRACGYHYRGEHCQAESS